MSFSTLKSTLVLNRDMRPIKMLPISTIDWQDAIKAVYCGAADVVHEYEDWEVHSPSVTLAVPAVIMVRQYVRFDLVVPWSVDYLKLRDRYRCLYCGKKFPAQQLTQDHVIPSKFGGQTNWENIVSACGPCNHGRGHNIKIQPRPQPYRPSYWELVKKSKELQIMIPHESWAAYLDWPEENVLIRGKPRKILRFDQAA